MMIVENAGGSIPIGQTQADCSWPELSGHDRRAAFLSVWHDRFGISPDFFDSYDLYFSSKTVYIVKHSENFAFLSSMPVQMAGMPFLRHVGRYMKPVTCAVQRFGRFAKRNVLDIDMEQFCMLCRAGEMTISGNSLTSGYVVIKTGSAVWGAGLFLEPDRLLCRLPKNMKKAIAAGC